MSVDPKLPPEIREVLKKGLLKRLPLTFLPFVNQHLREWDHLFPFECRSVTRLLIYLGNLDEKQLARLFRNLWELEAQMGVRQWRFETREQTIENASLLARSAHYQHWRREVQSVFDQVEQHAPPIESQAREERNRLVLLILPRRLPLEAPKVWKRWQGMGRVMKLDLENLGENRTFWELLFAGTPESGNGRSPGLLEVIAQRAGHSPHEAWVLDAGAELVESLLKHTPSSTATTPATLLSFSRLKPFRENFSQHMNSMRKDLSDADAVYSRLREVEVTPWCPPEIASQAVVREFLRSVFLTGNGAVLFGNSFVEWGASEALRRARPSFLVAHFGIRFKPQPFTGVAVFENQELASPVAPVEDLPGSAVDAQMAALYVWLAAGRCPEYHRRSACLCVAESLRESYVVAPPEFPLWKEEGPVTLEKLSAALRDWLA